MEYNKNIDFYKNLLYRDEMAFITQFNRETDIDMRDEDGDTCLHEAIRYDKVQVVRYLVRRGIDLNLQNYHQQTPLHLLCECWRPVSLIKFLVHHGAQLEPKLLFIAVQRDNYELVEYLIHYGVHVNSVDHNNRTPLHIAVINNRDRCLRKLLNMGADILASDCQDKRAIDYCRDLDSFNLISSYDVPIKEPE